MEEDGKITSQQKQTKVVHDSRSLRVPGNANLGDYGAPGQLHGSWTTATQQLHSSSCHPPLTGSTMFAPLHLLPAHSYCVAIIAVTKCGRAISVVTAGAVPGCCGDKNAGGPCCGLCVYSACPMCSIHVHSGDRFSTTRTKLVLRSTSTAVESIDIV